MRTLPRVDLPDPLGPMRAWTSPRSTVRWTPRRISTSPAEARRSSMTRRGEPGMGAEDIGAGERTKREESRWAMGDGRWAMGDGPQLAIGDWRLVGRRSVGPQSFRLTGAGRPWTLDGRDRRYSRSASNISSRRSWSKGPK